MTVRCLSLRAYQKNTLKGFADLELTRVGTVISDCTTGTRQEGAGEHDTP
jgi:hypothetical protein